MSVFKVAMLASGSKGNAALISAGARHFLVDVGISCRVLEGRLQALGLAPGDLDAVFITHEHTDHVKGLGSFLNKYAGPVYSSEKTWRAILARDSSVERRRCRLIGGALACGAVTVSAFPVPHDAVDPHGYTFLHAGGKCAYITDAGFVSEDVRQAAEGAETLILEANHDVEMLKRGSYPPQLKQRILSSRGHLSNEGAGWLLAQLQRLPETVFLAHLSRENNRPEVALATVTAILKAHGRLRQPRLLTAEQDKIITDFVQEAGS